MYIHYYSIACMSISIVLCYSVVTCLCAGRSWLYTALNEQSVESYIRMFAENQDIVEGFYLRYQLYYAPVLCSGTPLIWIPMGQKKVSVLVRCPYFMVQRTVVGERKVSSLERCPHFRGVLREVSSFQGCP